MLQAWRIVKRKLAAGAFSGEGAARAGGRWNSHGRRVVYTSGTKSLAALETLVHLNPPVLLSYAVFRIAFDDDLLEKLNVAALPSDWQAEPPAISTQAIGDRWLREARSAILAVPSAIVPDEFNYLLNPAHPDFERIIIRPPVKFALDPRLLE